MYWKLAFNYYTETNYSWQKNDVMISERIMVSHKNIDRLSANVITKVSHCFHPCYNIYVKDEDVCTVKESCHVIKPLTQTLHLVAMINFSMWSFPSISSLQSMSICKYTCVQCYQNYLHAQSFCLFSISKAMWLSCLTIRYFVSKFSKQICPTPMFTLSNVSTLKNIESISKGV